MKLSQIIKSKFKDQRGAVAVIVGVSMAMLIGFLALAIDVGYLYATKNELQNVADASALAGAGRLGQIYTDPDNDIDPSTYVCGSEHQNAIRQDAKDVVGTGKNSAGGKNISIQDEDIFIDNLAGVKDDFPRYRFNTNDYNQPDAVRVIARRDSDGNSFSISTFFARIFDIDSLPVTADATAALTGTAQVTEGGLPLPIGIGKARFESTFCEEPIKFYPTNDLEACGGWHVFHDDKTKIKQDILSDPNFPSPEVNAGDILHFTGGTDNAAFELLKDLFDAKKDTNDLYDENDALKQWPIDGDEDNETWTTTVVVYDWEDCSNPNTDIKIIGFAKIRIYEICTATSDPLEPITGGDVTAPDGFSTVPGPPQDFCVSGEKQIVARIVCKIIEPAYGGGGEFGVMGAIPRLVE